MTFLTKILEIMPKKKHSLIVALTITGTILITSGCNPKKN
jgi:hypothetical protein